jgi:hypothetical protein
MHSDNIFLNYICMITMVVIDLYRLPDGRINSMKTIEAPISTLIQWQYCRESMMKN